MRSSLWLMLNIFKTIGQSSEAQEQIAFADVILVNKTDLVSADEFRVS